MRKKFRREDLADGVTIYLGDCRDVLATLDDESVDMIWTDPPYGHDNHEGDYNSKLNEYRKIDGRPIANDSPDGMREVVDVALREGSRILKADCCCCCCCGGGGPRPTFAWVADRMDRDGLQFFHSVIWDKANPGLGWRYRRRHEMIMVAHRSGGKLLWADDSVAVPNIYVKMPPRDRNHPNEKPVSLIEYFVGLHAKPGEVVLDPFMGSGSTGVAAVRRGNGFVGVEIDPEFFDVARYRISHELERPNFLVNKPKLRQSKFFSKGDY